MMEIFFGKLLTAESHLLFLQKNSTINICQGRKYASVGCKQLQTSWYLEFYKNAYPVSDITQNV